MPPRHIVERASGGEVKNPSTNQKSITDIVENILALTKDSDYYSNSSRQAKVREYERQIDRLVYKLYDLTLEEIKIVEGEDCL